MNEDFSLNGTSDNINEVLLWHLAGTSVKFLRFD